MVVLADEPVLTMYTTTYCGDCHRSKTFLKRHGISFLEINIERDADAADTVRALNRGHQSVPTLVFADGTILTEPSNRQLAEKLDIAS